MHSGGKGGGGQKEKQMYNNERAKNNITKIQFTYLLSTPSVVQYASRPFIHQRHYAQRPPIGFVNSIALRAVVIMYWSHNRHRITSAATGEHQLH